MPPDKSFADLVDYWLAHRTPLKRKAKDDRSIIARYLRPHFGALRLRALGVSHADALVAERLSHLSKKPQSNILTLLISMLNVAVDLGWLQKVPQISKPRVRLFSRDYRYLRNEQDIRRLLDAARAQGEVAHALFATAIYTGMREGELAALQWQDVDFSNRLIRVQRSFDGPTKAEDLRFVPILDPLLPILREWRLRCPGSLLFPNRDGGMYGASGRIFQEVLHRVLDAAGFERQ